MSKSKLLTIIICIFLFFTIIFPLIKVAYATITDQSLMNILPFKSSPEYFNATQYSINYANNLNQMVISNTTIFQFNGTDLGSHPQCYAFLWKVQMEITGTTYNNPAEMTMNGQGYILKKNGASTYLMDLLVDNYDLQTGLTLWVGTPYDFWTIVLFNNTASTTMLNSLAYDYQHGGEPDHLVGNLTGGHSPSTWANPMYELIGTSDYWYGWVQNRAVYAEGTLTTIIETLTFPSNSLMNDITYVVDSSAYSGYSSLQLPNGNHSFTFPTAQFQNNTVNWVFLNVTGNGILQSGASFTFDIEAPTTIIAYYQNEPVHVLSMGWIMFGLGLIGLIMVFASWFVLKHFWQDGQIAEALMFWFILIILGFGLIVAWIGG